MSRRRTARPIWLISFFVCVKIRIMWKKNFVNPQVKLEIWMRFLYVTIKIYQFKMFSKQRAEVQ